MKIAKNHKNDEVLVIPLKHVSGLTGLVNLPGTLNLWAIAHENDQKLLKRPILGHASKTWIGSYEPCKSSRNPRTMDNSS